MSDGPARCSRAEQSSASRVSVCDNAILHGTVMEEEVYGGEDRMSAEGRRRKVGSYENDRRWAMAWDRRVAKRRSIDVRGMIGDRKGERKGESRSEGESSIRE